MAINETIGEPIPRGIIGDSAEIIDDAYGDGRRAVENAAQIAVIKEELRQLSHTVAQLAETTATYTRRRVENAAQTAVDRYPIASIAAAALVGYWLAGRNRR